MSTPRKPAKTTPKTEKAPPPAWAERLVSARKLAGYTEREDFAKALGLEYETYSRYERGETEPRIATWVKIKQITKQSIDSIMTNLRDAPDNGGNIAQFPRK